MGQFTQYSTTNDSSSTQYSTTNDSSSTQYSTTKSHAASPTESPTSNGTATATTPTTTPTTAPAQEADRATEESIQEAMAVQGELTLLLAVLQEVVEYVRSKEECVSATEYNITKEATCCMGMQYIWLAGARALRLRCSNQFHRPLAEGRKKGLVSAFKRIRNAIAERAKGNRRYNYTRVQT